jgi:hypothetical protein
MSIPSITAEEICVIMQLADVMIPGTKPWPQPSRTDLGRFIQEHCNRDADINALRTTVKKFLNHKNEAEFLKSYQNERPKEFRTLVDFVYLGYYTRPEVVRVIQDECGCDYISPPQPRGYSMPLELDIKPSRRGGYTRTSDVKRVDMSRLKHHEYFEVN